MLNILAIGAHPDDIEIGCGGTLLKYRDKGFSVFLMVLTDGQFGASKEVRKQEQIRSSKILDAMRFSGEDTVTHGFLLTEDLLILLKMYCVK